MVKLVLHLAVNGVMIVGLTLTGFWNNVALGLCWVLIAHALISLDCELKSEAELRSEHASPEKEPA